MNYLLLENQFVHSVLQLRYVKEMFVKFRRAFRCEVIANFINDRDKHHDNDNRGNDDFKQLFPFSLFKASFKEVSINFFLLL